MVLACAPETSAAAKWLTSHCSSDGPRLATAIEHVLNERYSGHWCAPSQPPLTATRARILFRARARLLPRARPFFNRPRAPTTPRACPHRYPDEPHRGSGFRSLGCSQHSLDRLLLKAAERAEVSPKKFHAALLQLGLLTLWVNPGEVKAVTRGGVTQRVYSDGKQSDNPYEKPRLKIEPTRVGTGSRSTSPTNSDSSVTEPTGAAVSEPAVHHGLKLTSGGAAGAGAGAGAAVLSAPPGLGALPMARAVKAC